jgi:hypothetical protein
MPQAKAQSRAAAPKAAAPRKRIVQHRDTSPVDRTTELTEEALSSIESGQRAAIEAVRKFVDTVDEALPALGDRPTRRREIVDAAMEMADRLVQTQYEFLKKVVQSAEDALSTPDERKK